MSEKIILSYQRLRDTELSTGSLLYRKIKPDGSREVEEQLFDGFSFADMITVLSCMAATHPDADIWFARTDRPGFSPIQMDAYTSKLIRDDPVAAIDALSYNPRR